MSASSSSRKPRAVAKHPQRPRGHARVAALLEAAAGVFAEAGYDAATMTGVAVRAGAPIGSLYQFFPTKALLAEALYRRETDALAVALDDAVNELPATPRTLDAVADGLFAALVDFCAAHPALPIVAERREADAVRRSKAAPGLREQLAEWLSRSDPPPAPELLQRAAILLLRVMKAAVSVQTNHDPGAHELIEDLRAMLHWRLASLPTRRPPQKRAAEG